MNKMNEAVLQPLPGKERKNHMKRRLAAAILTAAVTAGSVAVPAAAEWEGDAQRISSACVEMTGVDAPNTVQKDGWQMIGGKWYYRQGDSYRQGWFKDKGNWYFLDGQGAMVIGWAEIDGKYYCFGTDGAMLTGSAEKDGEEYPLGIDGAVSSELTPKTDRIYVTISGIVRKVA